MSVEEFPQILERWVFQRKVRVQLTEVGQAESEKIVGHLILRRVSGKKECPMIQQLQSH